MNYSIIGSLVLAMLSAAPTYASEPIDHEVTVKFNFRIPQWPASKRYWADIDPETPKDIPEDDDIVGEFRFNEIGSEKAFKWSNNTDLYKARTCRVGLSGDPKVDQVVWLMNPGEVEDDGEGYQEGTVYVDCDASFLVPQ